ncbi:MAG: glutamine amidotransferase family protein [Gammaproteobacteria bacterium]|nr:glutamine amidotransferase family protein [Gammaproteobacteria bacterium]
MCGIVGLYLKDPQLHERLGALFCPMLEQMTDRGPDSAGIAVYRGDEAQSEKVTVYDADPKADWDALAVQASTALGVPVTAERKSTHAIFRTSGDPGALRSWLERDHPTLAITSSGQSIEIFKEVGLPEDVIARFNGTAFVGSHALGHTRMATESAVTTQGAHPFNTGDDLCLVHNGSLSNHHRWRDWLRDQAGIVFQTDNDSEVAAGYLTWRLRQGATIKEALEAALSDLDGFFTFAIGTSSGFSVLRDPIACKPAVMAETDDWVAMASEFRALGGLPGIDAATVWEPEPATVYSWGANA